MRLGAQPEEVQTAAPSETNVVLAPAVCYSVYPQIADSTITEAHHFDAVGHCYRHEATSEYGRFRSFRMREFIVVGDPETAWEWRAGWIGRCEELFTRLGLDFRVEAASVKLVMGLGGGRSGQSEAAATRAKPNHSGGACKLGSRRSRSATVQFFHVGAFQEKAVAAEPSIKKFHGLASCRYDHHMRQVPQRCASSLIGLAVLELLQPQARARSANTDGPAFV